LDLSDDSAPEPDVAVVRGSIHDFRDHHPTTAVLVVKVADNSLPHDRKRRTSIYARAGIQASTWPAMRDCWRLLICCARRATRNGSCSLSTRPAVERVSR